MVIERARSASAREVSERRLRIVFLIRALVVGGAERQLVELAKALDRRVFDVSIVCFYSGGRLWQELLSAGVPVTSVDKRGRWEVFRFFLRLTKELRKQKPDILHGYMMGPNLMAMLMKLTVLRTRVVWGVRVSNIDVGLHGWFEWLLSRLEAYLSPLVSLVIFNSAAGESYCRAAGFGRARTIAIPNGIDVARFTPKQQGNVKLRISWGIPARSLVIGRVGRIVPMKDYSVFLKAASIFAKFRPDARFVCIGDGPDRYTLELRALARELQIDSKIVWTGSIEDMPSAYRALDICCSSSAFGEGTPNCVAEAMACGVPCVVTDVGDSRLVIGETGVLVPPKNPEALAEGLATMAKRIAENSELGKVVRERITSAFSVSMLVDKTSEALLGLQ
ncbi:MAG: group 1 glycosyl transferase [Acidobacteria bacterium]|nr:MAG: group 1 glycosyl transferase [Acidobacteriota bacterium]